MPTWYCCEDAAQLFLIYPLAVVEAAMADRILARVLGRLQGQRGIRRYPGDSYWTADYRDKLAAGERTADFSDRQGERDRLHTPGAEAQWCLFDPVVSVIYGQRYQATGDPAQLAAQIHYLERALNQLHGPEGSDGPLLAPELYFLEQGRWVPNDHLPLAWTQANLWIALDGLRTSLEARDSGPG